MAYSDDNVIVVRGGDSRKSGIVREAATGLLSTKADDSPLKTLIVWGGTIFGAYFGAKLLLGEVKKSAAERTYEESTERSINSPDSAPGLAGQLVDAFGVRGGASMNFNVDETTVFDMFITRKKIQTREFFGEVSAQYRILSKGRVLLDDLKNGLDSSLQPWQPDWNKLKPYIDKILRTPRAKTQPKPKGLKGLPMYHAQPHFMPR
jgi:hypothetical protein